MDCIFAEFKLEDTSNKNMLKGHAKYFNYFGLTYRSRLIDVKCDPVSGKCDCWWADWADDDRYKRDCWK